MKKLLNKTLVAVAVSGLMVAESNAIPDYEAFDLLLDLPVLAGGWTSGTFDLGNPGTDSMVFGTEFGTGSGLAEDKAYTGDFPMPALDVADIMFWILNEGERFAFTIAVAGSRDDYVVIPLVAGGIFADTIYVSTSALEVSADIEADGTLNVYVFGLIPTMSIEGAALGVDWATATGVSVADTGSTLAILGLTLLAIEFYRRRKGAVPA